MRNTWRKPVNCVATEYFLWDPQGRGSERGPGDTYKRDMEADELYEEDMKEAADDSNG